MPVKAETVPVITILDTPVHAVSMATTLAHVERFMASDSLHQIATTNPEFVMTAQSDPDFRRVLWQADLCIPDGVGLIWASRWLGSPLPERVAGSELVYHLARLCAERGWRLFLLGAAEGVAAEAAAIFAAQYPGLQVAGCYAGSPDLAENEAIVQKINASGAGMLLVAYGAPKQDKWIAHNRERLTAVRVAVGVGGSFDFVTGRSRRAPQAWQRVGLEWLYRLLHEPWRWRRMLALPRFVWRVLFYRRPSTSQEEGGESSVSSGGMGSPGA